MKPEEILSRRLNIIEVKGLADWAKESESNLNYVWNLTDSSDLRTALNSLWVITHLKIDEKGWLSEHQDEIIDKLLQEKVTAKKRMLLQLLREQEFDSERIRTDLLDFCFSKINSECEPYAIRAFSIYVAFNLCRHYFELLRELGAHLDMLSLQKLSPGLKSALRQTRSAIAKSLATGVCKRPF